MNAYPKYKDSGIDWIGEIPEHWKTLKIKFIADLKSGTNITAESLTDSGFPVYGGNGLRGYYSDYNTDGDYAIIGRQGALCGNINFAHDKFWATEHAVVCYPLKSYSLTWFGSLLEIMNLNQYSLASAQPGLSVDRIKNLLIPVPPLSEQQEIATYLDKKTVKIDELMAEKTKQVENLRSYRTSVITEAVTRGLNPDAPLRQSGIDWIGEIPEHWKATKLKYIGDARNGLTYSPEDICDADNGILVLRSSNIQNEQLCFDDNVYVSKHVEDLMMQEGDILICSRNGSASLVGKCVIIPNGIKATFGAFMMRYRSTINSNFTLYLIKTTLAQYKSRFTTSTINQLTNAMIGAMQVPVPPLSEQQEIAAYLDEKTAKIDKLIGELNAQVTELADYKQAVISEAVTGKVDVRNYRI
jgi:type I restriction enzyme S subunit